MSSRIVPFKGFNSSLIFFSKSQSKTFAAQGAAKSFHYQNKRYFQKKTVSSAISATVPEDSLKNKIQRNDGGPGDNGGKNDSPNGYLATLNNKELFSYGVIGLATFNKTILDLVIKAFPYIPMFLIKLFVYNNYCGGENYEEVKQCGKRLSERGINNMMISLTIEGCNGKDIADSKYIVDETKISINEILFPHTLDIIEEKIANGGSINDVPPGYVAIKPSAMIEDSVNALKHYNDFNTEYPKRFEKMVDNCAILIENISKKNSELSLKYPDRIAPFVVGVIDAEKFELQRGVYELQRRLFKMFNSPNKPISVIGTIQMYLKESTSLLSLEQELAKTGNYRLGLKLVRGAYLHSEPNRSVVHDTKIETDNNYNAGIKSVIENILSSSENKSIIGHLVVASHNAESQLFATKLLSGSSNTQKSNIVLGQLLGMADNITFDLISKYGVQNIIKYVPWGPPLETKEYLQRRLEENGDAVRSDNGWPLIRGILGVYYKKIVG